MEYRPPLVLGLQVDEVLGIGEESRVRTVVGTADLCNHLRHLGETGKHPASTRGDFFALREACARRQSAASPDGAFIQVRKKLGSDFARPDQVNNRGKE